MKPPDLREAAICGRCRNYYGIGNKCLKYRCKVDFCEICAAWTPKNAGEEPTHD